MTAQVGAPTQTNYLEEGEQVFTMPAPPPSGAYVMVPPLRPLRSTEFDEFVDDRPEEPTLTDLPRLSQFAEADETPPPAGDTDPAPPPCELEE